MLSMIIIVLGGFLPLSDISQLAPPPPLVPRFKFFRQPAATCSIYFYYSLFKGVKRTYFIIEI